ncbi:MAG: porin [Halochromatium sp.]|nr:porin [Halochromatium sp.]
MQKKILTLAIAAAMVAPAAAMAEATLYGKLNMSIDYADVKNARGLSYETVDVNPNSAAPIGFIDGDPVYAPGTAPQDAIVIGPDGKPVVNRGDDFKGWGISADGGYMPGSSRANRIGVKGSEDLGNGLKAIYQVELGLNLSAADDNIPSGNNGISYRNSFVGLAGNWGTFLVGRHDTPLKISTGKLDMFSDTMADYNGTVGFDDLRVDNAIAYISPSFSGFSFAGAIVAPGGATAGFGQNINSDSLAGAYSLAGIYNNGPFYASLAYESLDKDMFMNSSTSVAGSSACIDAMGQPTPSCNYVGDSYDKWRVGLGLLDWNGFTLSGVYEQQDNIPSGQTRTAVNFIDANGNIYVGSADTVEKQSLWQIQAAYAFGNNAVKAMYGSVDRSNAGTFATNLNETVSIKNLKNDLEGDRYTWAIGFDHNFSKRTKAYVLYTAVDDDLNGTPGYEGIEWSGFSAGMIHKF